jgi:membrane associated rhomboid family serine protease
MSRRRRFYTWSPALLWTLVGANVVVYVLWQLALRDGRRSNAARFMSDQFLVHYSTVLTHPWTLLSAEISHIDLNHLLFNCLALYVFGRDVHRVIGDLWFAHLYVVGAILASLGHVAYGFVTGDPSPALGASGAVMAIAVVYAALFPRRTLMVQFILPLPAVVAVGLYVLLDVFGVLTGGGNVAHAAHLGGAAYGLLFWAFYLRGRVVDAPIPFLR